MSDTTTAAPARDTLRALIRAQDGAPLATDDVLLLVLPLFEAIAELHAQGKVARLDADNLLVTQEGTLRLAFPDGEPPRMEVDAVHRVQPHQASGLNIIGALQRTQADDIVDLALQLDSNAPIERPVYLPGPDSWERRIGHHDEITDVFLLGMMLASLACGLDFGDDEDLRAFVNNRRNLFRLSDRLHPIVAAVIVEMTEVNRHERATDVGALATRLRTWRDQPLGLDVERALAGTAGAAPRRTAVLSHLRDRLFDLSRRNRLLYFRPSASTVNLTVASVPLVLQVNSIKPDDICTWGGQFAQDVLAEKPVSLQSRLRFDDQPYLPAALDKLITETRRDRAEYGFSNLRLVVAFLRWHNLKEAPDERIVTPLLWLPVELVKRKGVRDQYVIQCTGGEAEFNPVLRHHLSQLYDIRLPETVDLNATSIAEIHADILAQVQRSEPAVQLRLVEKASIRLVRQKAVQRMQQYQRRKPAAGRKSTSATWLPPYSYAPDDYRPLGRALFEHWVRPRELPQRFEAGAPPAATLRQPHMVEAVDREGYVLDQEEGHRYAWDLDLTQVTLANFNYKKMSLVRDYAQLLGDAAANPAFDRVFSIDPREIDTGAPAPLAPHDQWSVVTSDATQNAAVALARSGRSFIIQGPPGTGKSQTITNLIADYAGRGLRVLFVCEKRAALDVVFHRLRQSGLERLCCLIHDSQTDKKAFIADLKLSYETWIGQADGSAELQARRNAIVAELSAAGRRIEAFEAAMSGPSESLGGTVRALLRRLVALPAHDAIEPSIREWLPDLATWDAQRDLTQRLHRAMRERFGVDGLAGHVFARLSARLIADSQAVGRAQQFCQDAEALYAELDPLLDNPANLIHEGVTLDQACLTASDSQALTSAGVASHLDLLDTRSAAQAELQSLLTQRSERSRALEDAQAAAMHWHDKLTPADTESAIALSRRLEGSIMRWLQPAWWRLRGQLQRRYDFARHAVHPGYTRVLEQLAAEHAASRAMADLDATGRQRYGVADLPVFLDAVHALQDRLRQPDGPHALVAQLRQTADAGAAAQASANVRAPLHRLAQLVRENLDLDAQTRLEEIAEIVRDLREALDDLPDMLPLLRAVHASPPTYAAMLQRIPGSPVNLESLVADEALRRLERGNPVLARFGGAALAQSARHVAQAQADLLALNAQVVCATQHRQFAGHVHQSTLAASQLDTAGKAFKKDYATGRRELEHEFGKSMRHRSIRDLSDDETGIVLNDLKPIWLMSPLSVSDTLPLSSELFDVVIFDEASQIPTEEAVPALARARQVVVVGDEMQLPPTSFFSAAGDAGDNEVLVEEDGERIAINLDADSLLNQAARNLPATLLAWHYRSRHEALISFSNAAFYDGRLVTIPDRALEHGDAANAPLRSTDAQAGTDGAALLLAHPISFHKLADGVYADRRNLPEARYIALVVRDMLRRESGLSLGIVAFSEAQQSAIEEALETLAQEDADFATRLEREYVREDDDQFNGLFIKNLENVQGDERDVIILSICYAPGPDGRMLMNFGPINQRGGEKRLNVIFSRARHRMAVVSTIQAEAITNVHNEGAAALRAFLQFAKASASGEFERAQSVLAALNHGARDAFSRELRADSIRDGLADALRARGHEVHMDVGRSQFRCDLAIVDPQTRDYALAILLDAPDAAVTDTAERYVFRPGILRSFGWRVLDIPGKDWRDSRDAVLARIDLMLATGDDRALSEQLDDELPEAFPPPPAPSSIPPAAVPAEEAPTVHDDDAAHGRALQFQQGTSSKFWRVHQTGTTLTVSYGRIGTAGQTQIKQFESTERTRRELDKLVAEKLRKGYVDAPG